MDYKEETIAAIATPIGVGGIGIIRISGPAAENIARKVFQSKRSTRSFESFRLYLGHIIDPKSRRPVDEVLLSVMRAPFSYTREDVVEINSHSGYTILSTILQIVLQAGARLARPGEFTLRAFLNGRIDLTQAEAIVDLINAKGDMSVALAACQLAGGFEKSIGRIRQAIIESLARIEVLIDFPDEEPTIIEKSRLADQIQKDILKPIGDLIDAFTQRKIWHEGVTVVIVGRVNVGKSSILNRLLHKERAIVTPIPGTTRDVLECMVTIQGLPVKLVDTAGIRKIKGKIEQKGVDLTKTQLSLSDITLLVIDRSRPLNQYDLDLLQVVDNKIAIVVINKTDLPVKLSKKKVHCIQKHLTTVEVSALTGEGFKSLTQAIVEKIMDKKGDLSPPPIVPNLRHKMLLSKAATSLRNASTNIRRNTPLELIAADLVWAKDVIDEITGNKTNEEILDAVFGNFCLGK
ncbi:MAG: tRNA uridine-5-carboxymethylaminomethyl(34) synthesis GTPase MnmE [Deltaproteobacteria bacterium]|nr:tRNA uridine-5-carboxymethylaminomethyl(34) synthesis GTPase MnmE [Deltaproteobacteria bacterium]